MDFEALKLRLEGLGKSRSLNHICHGADISLEMGGQELRRRLLGRRMTNAELFRFINELGLASENEFDEMIGLLEDNKIQFFHDRYEDCFFQLKEEDSKEGTIYFIVPSFEKNYRSDCKRIYSEEIG